MSSKPLYNVSICTFADGSQEYMVSSNPICCRSHKKDPLSFLGCRKLDKDSSDSYTPFGSADYEIVDDDMFREFSDSESSVSESLDEGLVLYRKIRSETESIRRSRRSVEIIARANRWDYFVTLTFDPKKVDSFDYYASTRAFQKWCKAMKRKNPSMQFIFVIEKHPTSGRYHLHGLLSGCCLSLVLSAKCEKRLKGIFNIPFDYDLGFTEVSLVKDTGAASKYISKYIGKALGEVPKGANRYFVSNGVKRLEDIRETFLFDDEELPLVLDTLRGIADRVSSSFVDVIHTTFTYFKVFAPSPLSGSVALT